jgi:hypothetical protein
VQRPVLVVESVKRIESVVEVPQAFRSGSGDDRGRELVLARKTVPTYVGKGRETASVRNVQKARFQEICAHYRIIQRVWKTLLRIRRLSARRRSLTPN